MSYLFRISAIIILMFVLSMYVLLNSALTRSEEQEGKKERQVGEDDEDGIYISMSEAF